MGVTEKDKKNRFEIRKPYRFPKDNDETIFADIKSTNNELVISKEKKRVNYRRPMNDVKH
jgi:hypothetical protein